MSDSTLPKLSDLPLDQAEAIERICTQFEHDLKSWRDGTPKAEAYLSQTKGQARAVLLAELIRLELAYRSLEDSAPTPKEYRDRFPEHTWLDQLLQGSSSTLNTDKAQDAANEPSLPPTIGSSSQPNATESTAILTDLEIPGYELLERLEPGGMGVVYKARHKKLDRIVALKMILAGDHADEADRLRFQTEAEAIARLQHPGIVQIFEVGELPSTDGGPPRPFLALEFCEGGNLAKKLAGTPLPPMEAAALVEQLARAVQAAHEAKVIHRDLKLANVLLTADGTPKLTDFGLAKKLDEEGKTQTGAVMGSPSYMAPEQAQGRTADLGPTCDVYALGAILYECLTGRPPFKSATVPDTILQVVSEEPVSPMQLNPKIPRDLETVCLKCLEKGMGKRYASAVDLADELERYLQHVPIVARPIGRIGKTSKWVQRNPVVAALIATVFFVLVAGVVVSSYWADSVVQQKEVTIQANKELEAKHTQLLTILARSLSQAFVFDNPQKTSEALWLPPSLNEKEIEALYELGTTKEDRLGVFFVREALRSSVRIRQLRYRADLAIHAAAGLNLRRRSIIEQMLIERYEKEDTNKEYREEDDVVLIAAELGHLTPESASKVARRLSYYIDPDRIKALVCYAAAPKLVQIVPRMNTDKASDLLLEAMSTIEDVFVLRLCVKSFYSVSKRLSMSEAKQVRELLLKTMRKTKDKECLLALTQCCLILSAQMPTLDAVVLIRNAIMIVDGAELETELAEALVSFTAKMPRRIAESHDAWVADLIIEAMNKNKGASSLRSYSQCLETVVSRMSSNRSEEYCLKSAALLIACIREVTHSASLDFLLESLLIVTKELRSESATRLGTIVLGAMRETDNPETLLVLSKSLELFAVRMHPTDSSIICSGASNEIVRRMMTSTESRELRNLAMGLAVISSQMRPEMAAKSCSPAAIRLVHIMENTPITYQWRSVPEILSIVAANLKPGEATQHCSKVAHLLIEAMKRADPNELARHATSLAELTDWIPLEERQQLCANAVALIGQAMKKRCSSFTLYSFSKVLKILVPFVSRENANKIAIRLYESMDDVKDTETLAGISEALSLIASRMSLDSASVLCARAALLIVEIESSRSLSGYRHHSGEAMSFVAIWLQQKDARRTTSTLVRIMIEPPPSVGPEKVAELLSPVIVAIPPKEGVQLLVEGMRKVPENSLGYYSKLLSSLTVRLTPEEATALAQFYGELMKKEGTSKLLVSYLAGELASMPFDMSSEQASRAATVLVRTLKKTPHLWASSLARLSLGLSSLIPKMPTEVAARLCSEAALHLYRQTHPDHPLRFVDLTRGLSVIVNGMPRMKAAALLINSLKVLRSRHLDKESAQGAKNIATGFLSIADRFTQEEVMQISLHLIEEMARTRRKSFGDALSRSLHAVLIGQQSYSVSQRRINFVALVAGFAGPSRSISTVAFFHLAPQPIRCRLRSQQLVELLKQPTCVGQSRRIVLDQLELRYRRKFLDHWDFVLYAQKRKLPLDFETPPKRPKLLLLSNNN